MQKTINTIDIDIGGTFTDCYLRYGDRIITAKAPTTTYDLSIGFLKAIDGAAKEMDVTPEVLLREIDSLRYSTTLAMNRLIERKGPRLCLIATRGFEDLIFMGRATSWQDGLTMKEKRTIPLMDKPEPLIPRELVIGVGERVDSFGKVIMPLNEEDFREKLYYLVDQGVRGFVVCLLWSILNPIHERRIKEIIEEEYPDFCLGGMPVVLSSDVLPKQGEYARFMTTILNAYLQRSMQEELSHVTDRLRVMGYKNSLKMVHNTGGMAELTSTMAVHTYNGGPVAGLIGGAYLSKVYGTENTIVTDMGGTSFDLGMVVQGNPRFYTFEPVIDRWSIGITTLESRSIGAGGGSIAWIHEMLNCLEVGPRSAGAMPGPACYDQGGEEPTVTDADLALGYINPDCFHGGKIKLSREMAYQSIGKIAKHFQVDVEEAALMIKKVVDANMGNTIYKETVLRGFDPRDFILFAYGGAGPTHCCGYSEDIGVEKIYIFPYSPAFCAFGSSVMDMVRIYEQAKFLMLTEPVSKRLIVDQDQFNAVVRGLQEKATRDFTTDRVRLQDAVFELELDMKFGAQVHTLRCRSPRIFVKGLEDAKAIYEAFLHDYAEVFSPLALAPAGGTSILNFAMKATVTQPKPPPPMFQSRGANPKRAFLRNRVVFWEDVGGFKETSTYDMNLLECGNIVEGPAIIEALDTTVVLPPGKRYVVDKYLNGVIMR